MVPTYQITIRPIQDGHNPVYFIFRRFLYSVGGTQWRLSHYTASQKAAGSIPDEVIRFLN
jgi:hypothetical protein